MKENEKKENVIVIDSFLGFKSSKSDTNKQIAPFTRIRYKLEMLARQQGCSVDEAVKGLQNVYHDSVRRTAQKVGNDDFISADFSNVDPDNVTDNLVEDAFVVSSVVEDVKNRDKARNEKVKQEVEQEVKQESENKVLDNNNSVVSNSSE